MKGYIIVEMPERIIFPDRDSIAITPEEYFSLYNKKVYCPDGAKMVISVDYKGPDSKQICVLDHVEAGKIQIVDLSKLTVAQVRNLLKL